MGCGVLRPLASITITLTEVNCGSLPLAASELKRKTVSRSPASFKGFEFDAFKNTDIAYSQIPNLFFFSPAPLLPVLLSLLTSNIPPPPGRGTSRPITICVSRRRYNLLASRRSCPLTHCVRSLSARCLLANGPDDETTDETRNPDEERDDGRDEMR